MHDQVDEHRDRRARREDLVYGEVAGSLVFIEREEAQELATLYHALGTSSTWAEYRQNVPEWRYEEAVARMTDPDAPHPAEDDRFPGHDLPGVGEGDYPGWPAQDMLDWMPRDIIENQYAKISSSALNGSFLDLDPRFEGEIVDQLRSAGFDVTKESDLVLKACGYG